MKLLTWNIQWGRGADGRVDLARIAAHVRRLGECDVICLQEVSCAYPELEDNDGADQFAVLEQLFPDYVATAAFAMDADPGDGVGGRRKRFGNMLLSRHPVLQVFRHLLPWPCDPLAPSMQRVALEANLATPQGLLRVTTTHLEYYSMLQRTAQIQRLRALHAEAVAHARQPGPGSVADGPFSGALRAAPAILCGDCNFIPDSASRIQLLQPIDAVTPPYLDAWTLLHPGTLHAPTVGLYDKQQWPGTPFTFDYFFVSEDLLPRLRTIAVDTASDASDHQPLLLELA
ncbi:endonuclease/exonuclease/phosphatase family protein [Noviherbaspirillum sedimenti]|uniref:Endonuclease n=1 Tax=Noviherbaspirillum sedimenti TaxID=2320865 RepID=A0A3A3GCN6_9BURK|nr:endonuclease/exonuclease/phosphatase family protein [Noviherbaspirillum sedimenti]RJG04422.1 endonuclease [Noviherbaspirillum sedimenti]